MSFFFFRKHSYSFRIIEYYYFFFFFLIQSPSEEFGVVVRVGTQVVNFHFFFFKFIFFNSALGAERH